MTPPTGAVLVTGASTGIGRAVVEHLAARDVPVFAGVRRLEDAPEHANVTPLRLDVTSAEDITSAVDAVGRAGSLHGLVNNAGIGKGGALEAMDLDDLREQLEVNVVGQVAVTQGFLPLLRANGGGRVVFTGSISSKVGMPYMAPYVASKHAILGLAESLRREVARWNIQVTTLLPGTIDTPIWQKATSETDQMRTQLSMEHAELYGEVLEKFGRVLAAAPSGGVAPERVARATYKALFARRPKAEYLVGPDARILTTLSAVLPHRVVDALVARQLDAAK
jgi:NAD(P)-dependent dehydrogenase (short-subunit alcohol dehydrogenase family)